MSAPGFDVDVAQLDGIAATLDAAAAPLSAAADGATDVPRAGTVTGDVIAVLAALSQTASGLVRATAAGAAAARSAAGSYRSSDARSGAALDAAVNAPVPGF